MEPLTVLREQKNIAGRSGPADKQTNYFIDFAEKMADKRKIYQPLLNIR